MIGRDSTSAAETLAATRGPSATLYSACSIRSMMTRESRSTSAKVLTSCSCAAMNARTIAGRTTPSFKPSAMVSTATLACRLEYAIGSRNIFSTVAKGASTAGRPSYTLAAPITSVRTPAIVLSRPLLPLDTAASALTT